MIEMELKYNEAAKEAGIYIVSACGLDCIPSELGVIFTQQKFEGEMNAIEIYMSMWLSATDKIGPICNYGTWVTFVYNLAHAKELPALRKKLYPIKLPEFVPKLKSRYTRFYILHVLRIFINHIFLTITTNNKSNIGCGKKFFPLDGIKCSAIGNY